MKSIFKTQNHFNFNVPKHQKLPIQINVKQNQRLCRDPRAKDQVVVEKNSNQVIQKKHFGYETLHFALEQTEVDHQRLLETPESEETKKVMECYEAGVPDSGCSVKQS